MDEITGLYAIWTSQQGALFILLLVVVFFAWQVLTHLKAASDRKDAILDGLELKYHAMWNQQKILFQQQKALLDEVRVHLDECKQELRSTHTRLSTLESEP